jgi:hypothetical protein
MVVNGGPGLVRIPDVVVSMMREGGLASSPMHAITVTDPARALSRA